MKIFISWSKETSNRVALSLREWLPEVFPDVEPWLSQHDIGAGSKWANELGKALEGSDFGIICVTRSNLFSPWVLYESGAIAKSFDEGLVVPLLFKLKVADFATNQLHPLSQFQSVEATAQGVAKLLQSVNQSRQMPAPEDWVSRSFKKWWWPELENRFSKISGSDLKIEEAVDELSEKQSRILRALFTESMQEGRLISNYQTYYGQELEELTEGGYIRPIGKKYALSSRGVELTRAYLSRSLSQG